MSLALSVLDLWRLQRARAWHAPRPLRTAMMAGAGFVQGLYASGGPLRAAAMSGSGLDKSGLSATMLVVWLTLISGLTAWFAAGGRYAADTIGTTLWLLPVSFVGLWLGTRLHDRIDERQFRLTIDLPLLFAGMTLAERGGARPTAATTAQALYVMSGKLAASAADARSFLDRVLFPLWRVMPSRTLYLRGLDLRERHGYRLYDSMIVAAALQVGATTLYSEDLQHGQRIEALTIRNPFA